jgi:dihydrodipicolinate synthase/N-acetylneuraminate lyase
MKLKGIIPPIGTPLTSDERVDEPAMRRLVNYLIHSGVDGIFVNGSMGIFALLTDKEQSRAVEIVVDEVNRRVPVLAGIADTGTRRVIERAKHLAALGADYFTALPPFYFLLTQESGMRFFREVAQAVEKPLFLYNNPVLTKFNLTVESITELAQEPNVVGLKDSNQDCNRWTQIVNAFQDRSDFTFLVGTELLMPVAFILGIDGVVGGAHNVAPLFAVELYKAVLDKDYPRAFEMSARLGKVCEIFQYGEIWGGFEAAMSYLGIAEKVVASPYQGANEEEHKKVEAILQGLGIEPSQQVDQFSDQPPDIQPHKCHVEVS